MKRVENPVDFGIVITRDDGTIERFLEKPTWGEVFSDTINTGIYVLDPGVFDFIPEGEVVDFSGDVFPAVLDRGLPLLGTSSTATGRTSARSSRTAPRTRTCSTARCSSTCPASSCATACGSGRASTSRPTPIIDGPVLVGDNSRVEAGAVLAPYTVLGADVVVKADAQLERTVVHDHGYIGHSARLRGAVIGRANDIREHAHIEEGVVIGDECFVGARAIINPAVKIYPFKTVEAGALVTSSIVWESKGARTLFGRRGVRGLANVDITSEVAVRLAMAYGTALKKGSVVCTSRDTSRVARALKRAIIAGLNLSGVHVMDLELSTVPVTRFQVRSERAQGGISVRLAPDDPDSVEIRFFDEKGADIDEAQQRKIERLLYREDFRRAFAADIGDIMFPPRALEFYTAALEASVDGERLRQRSFKVVLDYSFGAASIVMPHVLAQDRGVGARGQPVRGDGGRDGRRSRDPREDHGRPRAHVGLRSRARVRSRRRDRGDHRRRRHRAHRRPGAARDRRARLRDRARTRSIALPVSVSREAERIARTPRRDRSSGRSCRPRTSWRSRSSAASTSPRRRRAGSSGRRSCPPTTRPRRSAHLLDLLARRRPRRCRRSSPSVPESHIAHEAVPTPWERKGAVMREMVERGEGPPDRARRRREDPLPRRVGARVARPRDRGHARVGRRRERRRGAPARRDPRRPGRRAERAAD